MKLSRIFICLGLLIGLPSVWETLAFSWNPDFQAPALSLGATHTNYHAFREFTLTVGAILTILYVSFQPESKRSKPLWTVMFLATLFYYGGWWLPWPLLGLHAPTSAAEIVHFLATVFTMLGVLLARKASH
jgi:hypothetical protein